MYESLGKLQKKEKEKLDEKNKNDALKLLSADEVKIIKEKKYQKKISLCQSCMNAFIIEYEFGQDTYNCNDSGKIVKTIKCKIPELYDIYGKERIINGKLDSYNHKVTFCSHYERDFNLSAKKEINEDI